MRQMLMKERLTDEQRKVINTLLELRSINKDLKTYAEIAVSPDGCVHPGFLPAGKDSDSFGKGIAGTGRPTASNPNIQNQPQSARRMYIPHDPSLVLLEADFSQLEARILAELAGDDVLRSSIRDGLHDVNARALGVDKTRAKNGFYGWAYGAGARTLHKTFISRGFDVPEADCRKLLDGFDRRFIQSSQFMDGVAREAATSYYLTNAFGRRRYFLGGSIQAPAARDFLPQSNAADIGWSVLKPLSDCMREIGGGLLAWIHDSALVEVPRGKEHIAADAIRDIMQRPWPELNGLSIPVEIKRGDNWGEMQRLQ